MTRLEYDLLRDQEPHLRLPRWESLLTDWEAKVLMMTRSQLIAGRTARLLETDCSDWVWMIGETSYER